MGLMVQGNTPASVSFGVCAQLGYNTNSARGRRAAVITGHVLDWYARRTANGLVADVGQGAADAYKRRAVEYVRQEVGFFWSLFFPFLINSVVQLVIDWLMSENSEAYREANG